MTPETPGTPTGNVIDIEQYRIRMKAIKLRIAKEKAAKAKAQTPVRFNLSSVFSVHLSKYYFIETKNQGDL